MASFGSGATELGVGYISVVPNAKGFRKDLDKSITGVEQVGENVGKRVSSGMSKALKVGAAAAGAAAIAGIGVAFKGGWERALDIDNGRRVLTGLYGDAEEATQMMANLQEVASNSSIDYSSYQKAAEGLAYTGVEAERATAILENVGSAIVGMGGTGENLGRVNDALANMVNMGRVGRQELNQLSQAGVPIFEGLATHMGVTVQELDGLIQKGVVEFDDVLSVMENGTGEYFENIMSAGDQVEQGLGATWTRLKDNVATAIGTNMVDAADMLGPMVANLEGVVLGAVDAVFRFIEALREVGSWIRENQAWIGPLAAAIGGAALAWGAWTGAITLWQTVTKVATAIQAGFNAVMAANPIMLVAIAIAALVAGLTYFFTQTETGQAIWESFTDAISTGWEWVKEAFATAWEFIQPIFEGIWNAIQFVGAIFGTVLLGTAMVAWNLFSAALQAVWNNVIKPVWDAFAAVMTWLWNVVVMPIWNAMQAALGALGSFFQWVWNSVIKPAWDALGAGIALVWNSVIRPAWDALKAALAAVGAFFQTTWNSVIKPAWDALGNGIRAVYDNVIQPAWDALKSGLQSVGDFFDTVVDGIRTVWDKMREHVAKPINFVIEQVWNNGLVRAWNTIADFIPGLPEASTLTPVAYATGGAVFGPGTGTSDSILARLSAGEHVLTAAEVKAFGGHDQVYAMRKMVAQGTWPLGHGADAMPRFREGGAVPGARLSPTPGEGGLQDIAKLAKRLIHLIWPEITTIGGYRQDAFPEHPSGRALDVMVGTGELQHLGDEVTGWALANDPVLPVQHVIWRQQMWYPGVDGGSMMADRGSPTQNHMDHPHIWYKPHAIDPNVVPEGLVGPDGLSRADRIGVIKEKVQEILDKMMDPLIEGMSRAIGSPPPEWLGIPPEVATMSKDGAVDAAFDFVENIGEELRDVYNAAREVKDIVVSSITGLWRDEGGFIPTGKSVVTNETGKPEAVLNWEQLERIRDILSSLSTLEEFQHLADVVGRMATTGLYDARAARYGITSEDDALVQTLWAGREQWMHTAAEIEGVFAAAGQKALAGYRDEALDFFGFKGLFDDVSSLLAPPQQQVTGTTRSGITGTATNASTDLTYGDPNVRIETTTVELETQMPDLSDAPGSGPVKDQVRDAMSRHGWDTGAQWEALEFIIQRESSWNPTAQNPSSTAYGLFQFLDQTWAQTGIEKTDNPRLQAIAGKRYIKDRYGDPLAARRFWEANGWYDQGGWLPTGVTLTRNDTGKPEAVLNPSQWSAISRQTDLVADIAQGGGGPMLHIENLVARDEDEAMRAAAREARRLTRSTALAGGWR